MLKIEPYPIGSLSPSDKTANLLIYSTDEFDIPMLIKNKSEKKDAAETSKKQKGNSVFNFENNENLECEERKESMSNASKTPGSKVNSPEKSTPKSPFSGKIHPYKIKQTSSKFGQTNPPEKVATLAESPKQAGSASKRKPQVQINLKVDTKAAARRKGKNLKLDVLCASKGHLIDEALERKRKREYILLSKDFQRRMSSQMEIMHFKEIHDIFYNSTVQSSGLKQNILKTKEGQIFMEIVVLFDKKSKEMKDAAFFPLELEEKFSLTSIHSELDALDDSTLCRRVRNSLIYTKRVFELLSYRVTTSIVFKRFMLAVILSNATLYAFAPTYPLDHPLAEYVFIIIYLTEVILKIAAFGIYLKGYGYFASKSNLMDFFILSLTFITFHLSSSSDFDLGPLRILRLFKVLEMENLQKVLKGLFSSFRLVLDTLIIFTLFMFIAALLSNQCFYGLLRHRCFSEITGKLHKEILLCGNIQCPAGFICGDMLENTENGSSNFDNFLSSLIQVFRILNLNNWFVLMNNLQRTFSNYVWIYFLVIIFFGNFFILNLLLAVLKVKYCEFQKLEFSDNSTEDISRKSKRIDYHLAVNKRMFVPKIWRGKNYSPVRRKARAITYGNAMTKNTYNESSADIPKEIREFISNDTKHSTIMRQTSFDKELKKKKQRLSLFSSGSKSIVQPKTISRFDQAVDFIKKTLDSLLSFPKELPIREDYLVIRIKKELEYHQNSFLDVLPSRDEGLVENKEKLISERNHLKKISLEYNIKTYLEESKQKEVQTDKKITLELVELGAQKNAKKFKKVPKTYKNERKSIKWLPVVSPRSPLNFEEESPNPIYQSIINMKQSIFGRFSNILSYLVRPKVGKEGNASPVSGKGKSFCFSPETLRRIKKEKKNRESKNEKENFSRFSNSAKARESQLRVGAEENLQKTVEELKGELIEIGIEENNDAPLKEIQLEYLTFLKYVFRKEIWSGGEVLAYDLKNKYTLSIFRDLNNLKKELWRPGILGVLFYVRYYMQSIYANKTFNRIHILLLTINTFFISEEDPLKNMGSSDRFNFFLYAYFLLELCLKFGAFGIINFFRKKLNIIDLISVLYFYLRIMVHYLDESFISSNPKFRFLHTVSVLRFLRVLTLLSYMKVIHCIVKKTYTSFIYIFLILFLLLLMYSLFGLRLFDNKFDIKTFEGQQSNFEDFGSAIRTTFNIITVDNWYDVYALSYYSVDRFRCVIFLVSLIFFGNYVMVNLLIAILLDGFEGIDEAEIQQDDNIKVFLEESDKDEHIDAQINKKVRTFEKSLIKTIRNSSKTRKNPYAKAEQMPSNVDFRSLNGDVSPQINWKHLKGCKYSLFIFSKTDPFRIFISKIIYSPKFENIVTVFVTCSCIHLAADSSEEFETKENGIAQIMNIFGNTFDVFYLMEAGMKIVSLGFIFGPGTYLRSFFGMADFLVVLGILMGYVYGNGDATLFKFILLLKVTRPMKLILKFKKMKLMLIAMISSLYGLLNIAVVLSFLWVTFAITGMSLFKGRFGYCEKPINFDVGIDICPQGKWINYPYNFDSIQEALFTLLAVSTFDNWGAHISIAVNSNLAKYGPKFMNNSWSANLFFISFILVGVWFMLNLIVGVLFSNFIKTAQSGSKNLLLTENQLKWVEMHNKILNQRPSTISYPKRGFRKFVWNLQKNKIFKRLTTFTLIINFLINAFFTPESNAEQRRLFWYFETYVDFFYISEGIMKMIAFRISGYFQSTSRRRECISVFISLFNCYQKFIQPDLFKVVDHSSAWFWQRIFYAFQIIPQVRLFLKIRNLKNLIHTISFSLPMILNVMALFFLVMFVYSLIGVIMFKDIVKGDIIDDYVNFKNIFYAFMTLFKACTGDQWVNILVDTRKTYPNCKEKVDCGSAFSPLFFISFVILIRFIFFNMFILILVQNFENFYKNPLNPIPIFKDNIKKFKKGWGLYCEGNQSVKIHSNCIVDFLKFMGEPLGVKQNSDFLKFGRKIMLMDMKCDEDGYIYFREFLYSAMKGYFRDQNFFNDLTDEAEILLNRKEDKFFNKLLRTATSRRATSFLLRVFHRKRLTEHEIIKPPVNQINPLYTYLNKLIIFTAWRKYSELIKLICISYQSSSKYSDEDSSQSPGSESEEGEGNEELAEANQE